MGVGVTEGTGLVGVEEGGRRETWSTEGRIRGVDSGESFRRTCGYLSPVFLWERGLGGGHRKRCYAWVGPFPKIRV